MIIETKYGIGDHVWVINADYENEQIEVFDGYISSINIFNGRITYYIEGVDLEYEDDDLVLYGLNITDVVSRVMLNINKKGGNNNVKQ